MANLPATIDLASSEDLSAKLDAFRAELLSDGHVDEDSFNGYQFGGTHKSGSGETRDASPMMNAPWYQTDDNNVTNVFRRFLGGSLAPSGLEETVRKVGSRKPSKVSSSGASSLFLSASMASAETEVMGSAHPRGSTDSGSQHQGPQPEMRMNKSSDSPSQLKLKNQGVSLADRADYDRADYGWRLDPSQSFSDWEIKIVAASGETSEYNVHRMALAAGPRASKYFTDLFGKQVRDFKSQRLRLEMPDESAAVFPVFLDFVYGEDNLESVHDKETVYAVFDQAEFFDTPLLKENVVNWIEQRLSWYDVPEFLPELDRFIDPSPLVRMAVEKCAAHFEELGTDFGSKIAPKYLQMLFEKMEEKKFGFERGVDYLSEMILQNCNAYPDIDKEIFLSITSIKYLPIIPVEAVMRMMAEETRLFEPTSKASSLQKRASKTLSENWEYFSYQFPNKHEMAAALVSLPSLVLAQLLVMTTELP